MLISDIKTDLLREIDKKSQTKVRLTEQLARGLGSPAIFGVESGTAEYVDLVDKLEQLKSTNPDLYRKIVTLY